jgi:hypothetical protein
VENCRDMLYPCAVWWRLKIQLAIVGMGLSIALLVAAVQRLSTAWP